jgi:hypothetical protein
VTNRTEKKTEGEAPLQELNKIFRKKLRLEKFYTARAQLAGENSERYVVRNFSDWEQSLPSPLCESRKENARPVRAGRKTPGAKLYRYLLAGGLLMSSLWSKKQAAFPRLIGRTL